MVFAGDPVSAGDINAVIAASSAKPIGRIVASGTQALADNSFVVIAFSGADDIDTHGFHDAVTNNSRVTPNVAGYYQFDATAFFELQASPVTSEAIIRKNGSLNLPPAGRNSGFTTSFGLATSAKTYMNGSTDYVELMVRQDSAGADNTNQSVQYSSVFEWELLRY